MLGFKRLSIRGFKSFANSTDIDISQGLTGIIGPNGCGKSNILESLRWAMGESSAKQMRAGGMDDVIFAGTKTRPPKETAQVTILLDNSSKTAGDAYKNADTIEVTRSITRDTGSNFKINGRPVRARDVQMLFCDGSSGARSPSLVSQGSISQMMTAKPAQRRQILEEAAGISGLHARRGEALARLHAAQINLNQVSMQLSQMQTRANSLENQARQAEKYKKISDEIKRLETLIAIASWGEIAQKLSLAAGEKAKYNDELSKLSVSINATQRLLSDKELSVNKAKDSLLELTKKVDKIKLDILSLDEREQRHTHDYKSAQDALDDLKSDVGHEENTLNETNKRIAATNKELASIDENSLDEKGLALDEEKLSKMRADVVAAQTERDFALQKAANTKAQLSSITQKISQDEAAFYELKTRLSDFKTELTNLNENTPDNNEAEIKQQINGLESAIAQSTEQINVFQTNIDAQKKRADDPLKDYQTISQKAAAVDCEIEALENIISASRSDKSTPKNALIEILQTQDGMEQALSLALGRAINASMDSEQNEFWGLGSKDAHALPNGAVPIANYIKNAPDNLSPALNSIGLVENKEVGDKLAGELQQGQCLVTQLGGLWRWDGYRISQGARQKDQNAILLEKRNRLSALAEQSQNYLKEKDVSKGVLIKAQNDLEATNTTINNLISAQGRAQHDLDSLRRALIDENEATAELKISVVKIKSSIDDANERLQSSENSIKDDKSSLEGLHAQQILDDEALSKAKTIAQDLDNVHQEAKQKHNAKLAAITAAKARSHALRDEKISLKNQSIRAQERISLLNSRITKQEHALEVLKTQTPNFSDVKAELLEDLKDADKHHLIAERDIADKERATKSLLDELNNIREQIAQTREMRAVSHANHTNLQEQRSSALKAIENKFGCSPEMLATRNEEIIPESQDIDSMAIKCSQLGKRLDSMGAVNLRAQAEAQAAQEEISDLQAEKDDLEKATEELQYASGKLNRQARAKLLEAFKTVDGHFQKLFVRLFGGGNAHLSLTKGDDPLEAGLEVFAQPAGKTLQSLTLLSGGEQTMASIALILALFLTSPAPLCVLDEIDAALDDANVERVCDIIQEIARLGSTRFLIITHHRLTMSRMDRLYGVTMMEKGISTLVGVELQESFDFSDKS